MREMFAPKPGYAMRSRLPSIASANDTEMLVQSDVVKASFQGTTRFQNCDYAQFRIGRFYYWQLTSHCEKLPTVIYYLSDCQPIDSWDKLRLSVDDYHTQLKRSPLEWQRRGLQQTASGYGSKLTTELMVFFEWQWRRVYCTQYSNAGICWFNFKGKKIVIG